MWSEITLLSRPLTSRTRSKQDKQNLTSSPGLQHNVAPKWQIIRIISIFVDKLLTREAQLPVEEHESGHSEGGCSFTTSAPPCMYSQGSYGSGEARTAAQRTLKKVKNSTIATIVSLIHV